MKITMQELETIVRDKDALVKRNNENQNAIYELEDTVNSLKDRLSRKSEEVDRLQKEVEALKNTTPYVERTNWKPITVETFARIMTIVMVGGEYNNMLNHIRSGNKIEAIKALRELTHCGLKEVKETVEALLPHVKNYTAPLPTTWDKLQAPTLEYNERPSSSEDDPDERVCNCESCQLDKETPF